MAFRREPPRDEWDETPACAWCLHVAGAFWYGTLFLCPQCWSEAEAEGF